LRVWALTCALEPGTACEYHAAHDADSCDHAPKIVLTRQNEPAQREGNARTSKALLDGSVIKAVL